MQIQVFSRLKEKIVNNRIKLLGVLFLMLFLLFAYFAYQSISLNYLPIYSDEYGYYLDAKSFWLHNRIDAVTTLNERYSLVGQSGFHGFTYTILYGAFFKLFAFVGIAPSIMLANMVLVLCMFVFLALSKISLENKLLISIVLLSNFIFIIYISSSMTEIFHYVFAVVVGYLLYLVYQTRENRYFYTLIALVFFLLLFRESWVFVFFGLFPLAKSWRDFLKYTVILFLGLTAVILCQKYFQAAFPVDYFHSIKSQLGNQSLLDTLYSIYEHFLVNVDKYFVSETYERYKFVFYYKYLFVALLLYSLYVSFQTRDRAIISGTIIATIFFSSLLVLYDPFGWREVRVLAVPFVLLTVVLILSRKYVAVLMVILFQLFNINAVLDAKLSVDRDRQHMNVLIKESQPLLDDFKQFEKYVTSFKKKKIIILMNWGLIPPNKSPLFYRLPLTSNGKFISYSFIYRSFDIMDSICDLYISKEEENFSNMKLLGKNKNFFFYKRIEQKRSGD